MGHSRKDIASMGRCTFDAIAMIYASFAGLGIDVEVLQIIVEIDGTGAEVSSEERRMCREDCRHVYSSLLRQWQCDAGQPFVEMDNNGSLPFVCDILRVS